MIRVVLLGTGNVATHLVNAFLNAKYIDLVQVFARKKSNLKYIQKNKINTTSNLSELKDADIYIIAIADDAIAAFSEQLNIKKNALVVHTSGSVAMNAINNNFRKGVFYPLQTFSKEKSINFKTVPLCLEAEHNEDLVILEKLASAISNAVYFIDSKQRESLHIAAVFVNNFTNHLYHIGKTICYEHEVPFAILQPLIQETAKKILDLSPYDAQTGPARRNDSNTITRHLEQLPNNYKEIYSLLTKSIRDTYEQEL
jgi:predicted short-subunit dehydrogenase-like oxidoreductase (DUF2520 family)